MERETKDDGAAAESADDEDDAFGIIVALKSFGRYEQLTDQNPTNAVARALEATQG